MNGFKGCVYLQPSDKAINLKSMNCVSSSLSDELLIYDLLFNVAKPQAAGAWRGMRPKVWWPAIAAANYIRKKTALRDEGPRTIFI